MQKKTGIALEPEWGVLLFGLIIMAIAVVWLFAARDQPPGTSPIATPVSPVSPLVAQAVGDSTAGFGMIAIISLCILLLAIVGLQLWALLNQAMLYKRQDEILEHLIYLVAETKEPGAKRYATMENKRFEERASDDE